MADIVKDVDVAIGIEQAVVAEVAKPAASAILITQSVSPATSIYNRSISSTLKIQSTVRILVKRGSAYSTNGVNFNPRVAN